MILHKIDSEARPVFRFLAGILSVLSLLFGLPAVVYMAISRGGHWWLEALNMLIFGAGFATVAYSGRWMCFRNKR